MLRKRHALSALILLLILSVLAVPARAGDRPFIGTSNWGGTGLYEIPNARVLEDGVFRLGYATADPFTWYTVGMGVLPGVEITGSYTEIKDHPTDLGGGAYGDYKDKAVDFKFQFLPETADLPAMAIGANDFIGTRLFPSEYLVSSKRIGPLDFTAGVGTRRLGQGATETGLDSLGPFGGVEWAVHERVNLLAEYNPIDYEKDQRSAKGVPEGASSPINVGARVEVLRGFEVGLSWQRGDTFGVSGTFNLLLGKSLLPKQPDPPYWKTTEPPPFSEENAEARMKRIRKEILEIGFKKAVVFTDDRYLTAEFENNRYVSNQKAAGRVLRVLLANAPPEIERIEAVLTKRRIPMLRISVKPGHFDDYLMGKMRPDIFERLVKVETVSSGYAAGRPVMASAGEKWTPEIRWGIKPEYETFLNDPSGVLKYRFGVKPWAASDLWKGAQVRAAYTIPFYSDISSSNAPAPDAVRSDAWKYLGDDPSLSSAVYDQVLRITDRTFGRVSTGYFEPMYAGVGGEVLTFFGAGNLALGAESDWVRKRVPGTAVDLYGDKDYYTVLGNAYYRFTPFESYPPLNIDLTLQAQYGRFLGGDTGWRFEAKRTYKETGLEIGAWYSVTDTDGFVSRYNRGYNDKGVFIRLPARMFTLRETSTLYTYDFQPWNRDVAARVVHDNKLFDFGGDLMPSAVENNLPFMKK